MRMPLEGLVPLCMLLLIPTILSSLMRLIRLDKARQLTAVLWWLWLPSSPVSVSCWPQPSMVYVPLYSPAITSVLSLMPSSF